MTPGSVAARLLCLCFIKMSVLKVIYSVIKIKDSRDSPGIPVFKTPSGLPFPSPGDLPDPGVKPKSPALQADSLPSEPSGGPLGSLTLSGIESNL